MNLKKVFISLLLLITIWGMVNLPAPLKVYAVGLGFHLNTGGIYYGLRGMGEKGDMTLGAGIMIDTSVAKDSIFNYRFKGDYYATLIEAEVHRMKIDNAFGFGIVRNNKLRFWMGPKFGFGYALTNYEGDKTYSYNFIDIFVGAVFGINYHVTELISLSIETGYNYGTLFSMKKVSEETTDTDTEKSKSVTYKTDQNHPYHEAFITFGIIFRIKDQFPKKETQEVKLIDIDDYVE